MPDAGLGRDTGREREERDRNDEQTLRRWEGHGKPPGVARSAAAGLGSPSECEAGREAESP